MRIFLKAYRYKIIFLCIILCNVTIFRILIPFLSTHTFTLIFLYLSAVEYIYLRLTDRIGKVCVCVTYWHTICTFEYRIKRWPDVVKHLMIDFDWPVRNRRENSQLPLDLNFLN